MAGSLTTSSPDDRVIEFWAPEVLIKEGFVFQRRTWYGRKKGTMATYKWKTRPYKHQVAAIKKLLANGYGGALLMEPRTGKTKTAIDYASIQHQLGRVSRVLIICPVSVIGVWQDEIATHCPFPARVTIWDKDGRKETPLPRFGDPVLDFVIMNYDAFSTPADFKKDRKGVIKLDSAGGKVRGRTGGRYAVKKKIELWQPDLCILDESHRIKSPSARKSTMLHTLGPKIPYRVIMTGTVVTKKKRIFDIYSQWKFLNPDRFGGMNFGDFKHEFGVWTQRNGFPQWIKNKNENRLHRMIHLDSFAVTRAECFDLPPRLPDEILHVELGPESGRAYDEMAEDMVAKIHTGEIAEASIALVRTLRLQQITSGIVTVEPSQEYPKGRLARVGDEKIQVLKDRLEDFFESDEKVVVAAKFVADLNAIVEIGKQFKVPTFLLRGGIKRQDRDSAIKAFRAHQGAALFVVQPQAGSLGIDLSTAGTFIWYSLTSSYVDFSQCEDRIALNPVGTRFVYLLARGTVDEVIYDTLQGDGDVAKAIMKSPERLLREGARVA